ncbi:MAG: hypothetical protein U9Q78_01255, partial [Chloroflexota bacterium]|nr:hypothetical protein [Chloroflexota bacterium]
MKKAEQCALFLQIFLPTGVLALLVHGLVLTPVGFSLQAAAGLIWAGAVPGTLAGRLLLANDRELDGVERALLAVGLGYVSLILGTLILHFIPGPLTRVHLLIFSDALVLALLALVMRAGARPAPTTDLGWQRRW